MAKVVATQRGFYGRQLREAGDIFDVPDGAKASWWKPVDAPLFGGKGDHDGDGQPGGSLPGDASTARRGRGRPRAETVTAPTAEPFGDAPEPVRVENEINAATGATQPDWIAPGDDI